jgi:hypothetical protein
MVFLGILVAQFCNLVISANPPGYGVINCDPEQGYLIFPRCLNESGTSNSVWIDVDSGGTLFRYLQYNSNMQCEGTPNFNVTFGPQCAFLNAVKLDFTFGVPPSQPVDPPVTPPVEAPLEPPVYAPVLAPVAVPTMALSMKIMFPSKRLLIHQQQRLQRLLPIKLKSADLTLLY